MTLRAVGGGVAAVAAAAWGARHAMSPAAQRWGSPELSGRRAGQLYARSGGAGNEAIVLLHGLVATGDVFGAAFEPLANTAKLLVPDLLGFGRSLDESRSSFSVAEHLDALDELADETGLSDSTWTLGAHSMGSALALHWAARHPGRVRRIVCWGAPIYSGAEAVRSKVSESTMARLFVLDTRWAERACSISCRHRSMSGWLGVAAEPSLPIPISRTVSLHTWPAYRDAMRHLVIDSDWASLLDAADANGIAVNLGWGVDDKIGDRALAGELTHRHNRATISLVQGADHHLPMTHADLCCRQLLSA